MAKPESDILTILEVARYLKVAERTVYRLAAAKKIPAFKVGGAWRFSRAEIDQWIRRQSSSAPGTDSPNAAGSGLRRE
jgi:excisionase family DNA binding protein